MSSDQKRSVMRRFIHSAPPGQMNAVLRALRTLMQDDGAFMEHAPPLVMERLVRHHSAIQKGTDGPGATTAFVEACHMPHWSAALPTETRDRIVQAEGLPEAFLEYTFVDWDARAACVIDPLTSSVVCSVPFGQLNVADAEGVGAVVEFCQRHSAPQQPGVVGSFGFTQATLSAAALLLLRDCIAIELRRYAARRYEASGAQVAIAAAPNFADAFGSEAGGTSSESGGTIHGGIAATHVNEAAQWEGRWTTDVSFALAANAEADSSAVYTLGANGGIASPESVAVTGRVRVDFQYYEDGNIQMDSTTPIEAVVALPSAWVAGDADAASALVKFASERIDRGQCEVDAIELPDALSGIRKVARRAVGAVENAEDALQERMSETSRTATLTDSAMRPLRRKLPVTKQLYDFSARGDRATTRTELRQRAASTSDAGADA